VCRHFVTGADCETGLAHTTGSDQSDHAGGFEEFTYSTNQVVAAQDAVSVYWEVAE
jgi:hypothetical protein